MSYLEFRLLGYELYIPFDKYLNNKKLFIIIVVFKQENVICTIMKSIVNKSRMYLFDDYFLYFIMYKSYTYYTSVANVSIYIFMKKYNRIA